MFLLLQNFVGLSVSDGYIATGSETNEVCIFHMLFVSFFFLSVLYLFKVLMKISVIYVD